MADKHLIIRYSMCYFYTVDKPFKFIGKFINESIRLGTSGKKGKFRTKKNLLHLGLARGRFFNSKK